MVGWDSRLTTQYLLKLDVGDVERVLAFRPYRPPPVEESPSLSYPHGWFAIVPKQFSVDQGEAVSSSGLQ